MASEHYAAFIDEAFVKPIRSVLIVDDDYPTFDEMLDAEIKHDGPGRPPASTKGWYSNPARIKHVIDSFRRPERPLLVDIHDGSNVDAQGDIKVAAHLHQSDLLVLDYELDKLKERDGTRAIQIIRSLMTNGHFNLVVVHTSEELDYVFNEIVIGLLGPQDSNLTEHDRAAVQVLLDEAEDEDEGLSTKIVESVGLEHYLHSRLQAKTFLSTMGRGNQPYAAFSERAGSAKWDNATQKIVLQVLIERVEANITEKMNAGSSEYLKWATGQNMWIKCDSVFIAFSKKSDNDDLIRDLQDALGSWNPQPSRLFMAKLRAEMDEHGVTAQSQALGNQYALAHWYSRLLTAGGEERRWLIAESMARHSDRLLSTILPRVEKFATDLVAAESKDGDTNEICKGHFKVDLSKSTDKRLAEREHNAFVCSLDPVGWHLNTGHVFEIAGEHWVCLSPACDLVPSQLSSANLRSYGERLPFMAIKLHPISDGKSPDVQSNRFIFLHLDGGVKGFCFNEGRENSSPHWHTLYAESRGIFDSDFTFKVIRTEQGKRRLISNRHPAKVVGQLRYEYALNLMQRFGIAMTRIGLDFVGSATG